MPWRYSFFFSALFSRQLCCGSSLCCDVLWTPACNGGSPGVGDKMPRDSPLSLAESPWADHWGSVFLCRAMGQTRGTFNSHPTEHEVVFACQGVKMGVCCSSISFSETLRELNLYEILPLFPLLCIQLTETWDDHSWLWDISFKWVTHLKWLEIKLVISIWWKPEMYKHTVEPQCLDFYLYKKWTRSENIQKNTRRRSKCFFDLRNLLQRMKGF